MSCDPLTLAAPGVGALRPYQPGKPTAELERELGLRDTVKLASNENPLGPPPSALAALQRVAPELALYPDGNGHDLKRRLAEELSVPPDRITLGNGSNDVLVLLAETFLQPGLEAVYSQYGFAVFALATQATGAMARVAPARAADDAQPLGHDLDAMAGCFSPRTRLVFVANPNNPTGSWLQADELRAFIARVPAHAIVVVDEAYVEYVLGVEGFASALPWLEEFPNLVVTRTFSKAWGLAGMRVGYAVSGPAVADLLNRIRQPFNVNLAAQAMALAALDDRDYLQRGLRVNREGIHGLQRTLAQLGLWHGNAAGNFLLVDTGRDAAPVYQALLQRGVIVRPVANYGLPEHLRISIGTPEQMQRLDGALRDVFAGGH